jgi:serine/threonine-protein kinase
LTSFAVMENEDALDRPARFGQYVVVREVGRGGMARVFLAHDSKHNREVAVKVIRHDVAASLGRGRFLQEIAIAARLRHPNIVPMYDSGETDGVLYFVMPYEAGPSLKDRMRQDPPLPLVDRISILRDIARALAYAHEQGVVHRDIKPDNILLSGGAAVVSDFGIAKALSAAQSKTPSGVITQDGARIGTPSYMAPEQALGDPDTDHRADIYSFGCLAYEMFAGKPPFDFEKSHEVIAGHVGTKPVPILEVCKSVPERVATLIMRCLQKLPAERPQSAHELLRELEAGQPAQSAPVKLDRATSRAGFFAVLALAVVLASAAGYFVLRGRGAEAVSPGEATVSVLPMIRGGDSL